MAGIQYDRMIMEKKKQSEISEVENQAHNARVRSQADADFYLVHKQAEANKVVLANNLSNFGHRIFCIDLL